MPISPSDGIGKSGLNSGSGVGSSGLSASTPAAVFSPANLFDGSEVGDYWDMTDSSTLYQDTAGTTPVTTSGDPVGRVDGKLGIHNLLQSSTTLKGQWASPTGSSRTGVLLNQDWMSAELSLSGDSLGPTVTMAFSVVFTSDGGTSTVVLGCREDASNGLNNTRLSSTTDEANTGELIGGSFYSTTNGVYSLETEYSVICGHDNSAPEIFINVDGSEATSASASQSEWGSTIYMGANGFSLANTDNMLRGAVFRACVINRVLTSQEKTDLLTWLAGEA